jgi:amino acid adenylation domain-containing protein
VQWNNNRVDCSQHQCIHHLFEQQVELFPDGIAVESEQVSLSYRQLNNKANQLAHYLQEQGVKPDTLVGICMTGSAAMMIGLLAVLKAGGAYVPLDPAYPKNRLAYMLADSGVGILLSHSALTAQLPLSGQQVLMLDENAAWQCYSEDNVTPSSLASSHLAYVIYTSGSTGNPKGVMIEHRNVVAYYAAIGRAYNLKGRERVMQFSSFSFDIFIEELCISLLSGGTLLMRQGDIMAGTQEFCDFIINSQVEVVSLPTAAWNQLIADDQQFRRLSNSALSIVIVGGEALTLSALKQWQQMDLSQIRLFNTYGPTEATVIVSVFDTADFTAEHANVPIGKPTGDTVVYVVDCDNQLMPQGGWGELCVGGAAVARGYLNEDELTAASFVVDHFSDETGAKMYRTGDLVRWLPDGNLDFIGRVDNQVKIRGFRIEPGEIEAVLNSQPCVTEALVIARDEPKRLVAYVVLQAPDMLAQLRTDIKAQLPDYMVPAVFVVLAVMPLTANGKVDRKALPQPDISGQLITTYIAPQTEIEIQLTEIWQDSLKLERVGTNDNFFDLGGHSLLGVMLVSTMKAHFSETGLQVRDIFEHPTIATIAPIIAGGDRVQSAGGHYMARLNDFVPGKTCIYCVPGAGGIGSTFAEIARIANGQLNILAFTHAGIIGDEQPHQSIEHCAQQFVDELMADEQAQCYHIAGHSYGGFVALEMVYRLRQLGKEATLILIDTMLYSYFNSVNGEVLASVDSLDEGQKTVEYLALISGVNAGDNPQQTPGLALGDELSALLGQQDTVEFVAKIEQLIELQGRLQANYRVTKKLDCRVLNLTATRSESTDDKSAPRGWYRDLSSLPVTHQVIEGDHYSMLRGEGAGVITALLVKFSKV